MVASVKKRRRLRKKNKNSNRTGKIKCKATKKSWNPKRSLKGNFRRLGIREDPNSDIKYSQFARHERIRDILRLRQAKSDLKWKLKSQSRVIEKTTKKLKHQNSNSKKTNNNNNNNNINNINNRNNRNNWQLPKQAPEIAKPPTKSTKKIDDNVTSNNNNKTKKAIKHMKTYSKTLLKSQNEMNNEMSKIDKELNKLSDKFDKKLGQNERMTYDNAFKATKGRIGGNLSTLRGSYLRTTLELAMNSMPNQVKNHLSQHRKEYFQRLIYKYGNNYKAMARDKQLNFFQLTKRRIQKDIDYSKHCFVWPDWKKRSGQRIVL